MGSILSVAQLVERRTVDGPAGGYAHVRSSTLCGEILLAPRSGHPLAGGRLGQQNAARANLGQTRELLAQEHEHIGGGRRQAGILTR